MTTRARVITSHGNNLLIETHEAQLIMCKTKRSFGLIICGDWVEFEQQHDGTHVITARLARRGELARLDRRHQLKPIAANIDQLIIVAASQPAPSHLLINTYLIYAHTHQMKSILVFNKDDLARPENIALLTKEYTELGYPVIYTNTKKPNGVNDLLQHLNNNTSILVGQSGVGKSSLINYLLPDRDIQTKAISTAGLGNHTTTTTTLYHVAASPDCNGEIIDSPGVREFSVGHLTAEQIRQAFIEFNNVTEPCRFNNCRHINEPGCGVQTAVKQGNISMTRWEHYCALIKENQNP
ncbi:MAG: ribosome small subunit-dependent GTPase A [Gammaproteobacteria bacterium]|nr:ribosome small subunit-dependent GTPase A [Gammaproteobacteria bacterium]